MDDVLLIMKIPNTILYSHHWHIHEPVQMYIIQSIEIKGALYTSIYMHFASEYEFLFRRYELKFPGIISKK